MPAGSAAIAEPTSPSERARTPHRNGPRARRVPAQVMHSSTRRRLTPLPFILVVVIEAHRVSPCTLDWVCRDVIGRGQGFIPGDFPRELRKKPAPVCG